MLDARSHTSADLIDGEMVSFQDQGLRQLLTLPNTAIEGIYVGEIQDEVPVPTAGTSVPPLEVNHESLTAHVR